MEYVLFVKEGIFFLYCRHFGLIVAEFIPESVRQHYPPLFNRIFSVLSVIGSGLFICFAYIKRQTEYFTQSLLHFPGIFNFCRARYRIRRIRFVRKRLMPLVVQTEKSPLVF